MGAGACIKTLFDLLVMNIPVTVMLDALNDGKVGIDLLVYVEIVSVTVAVIELIVSAGTAIGIDVLVNIRGDMVVGMLSDALVDILGGVVADTLSSISNDILTGVSTKVLGTVSTALAFILTVRVKE